MESAATATAEPGGETASAAAPVSPVSPVSDDRLAGRPVLVYDDQCRLCSAVAASLRRRDHAQRMALVGASNAADILASLGVPGEAARSEVYFVDRGAVLRGVAVVPAVLAYLPRWRHVAPLFRIRPFSYLLAGAWLLVKQLRHEV